MKERKQAYTKYKRRHNNNNNNNNNNNTKPNVFKDVVQKLLNNSLWHMYFNDVSYG
jgi:hypothetical protein